MNDLASLVFEYLAPKGEQRMLRRGDVLVHAGESADELHFILSGRLTVHAPGADRPIAELAQGEPVGEIGFFAGLPRTATVVALRDSTVLTIGRDTFESLGRSSSGLLEAIIVTLARRISAGVWEEPEDRPARVRTLAVVAAGSSDVSASFIDRLRTVFLKAGGSKFLGAEDLEREFPGASPDDPEVSHWLNTIETEFETLIYLADDTLSDWTKKCIRQADGVLLVAGNGADTAVNSSEAMAMSLIGPQTRRLIVIRDVRSDKVSGTEAWLREREVHMHHHVALCDDRDIERLHRFVTGTARGFIAGAGGALGSAHVGLIKALCEAGAEFDILGGTSVGAAMMAAFAYGATPERVDEGTDNIFVKSRSFCRPTIPRYGLIDHKNFDRALRAEYDDTAIEDLWTPYFAVSTNLSTGQPMVHRHGPVWQAVRASGSIPGLLPPFFTSSGEMLVDGAVTDNTPVGIMKRLKTGPNVISSLTVESRKTYDVAYDEIPGPREMLARTVNPFSRSRLPQAPGLLQVLLLSMLANRPATDPGGAMDCVFRPSLAADIGQTSWERHSEIFADAYGQATAWIAERQAAGDEALAAILARS